MKLDKESMDIIFDEARTHKYFEKTDISDDLLIQIYDELKTAPTWANCQAGRFIFLKSPEAKQRLIPHLDPSNVKKTEDASVTVIIAHDTKFYEYMPRLYPHGDYLTMFAQNKDFADKAMLLSSSLQGAYLIIAARALGLDCGPMGGFDNAGVDKEFFPDGRWKSNFLCNLGIGDKSKLHPRDDRFKFDEACKIL
ncbi:malonic semialdehyde reductase [Methanimicrococcus blatticola]|uniref:3-hydroxypropanoate dehydrogenase n=1 Tax=Methanimicrococcus blatticola TaxID=91560 RepID=A0A484F678_9EURY|nr:malonic semialdehyde reductase [Methanimicrococcus blatticola]MBZ3935867.1 malonic semialdehyde reductase [Methanimicrococcus blatticola]MCC2508012.1 malonic semialdehyde reductase [Methanimicrococcus blatticola]TDQ68905.1 3-hydroxypropanoate dehydrogenase [Methanimicrococcus blatticola]